MTDEAEVAKTEAIDRVESARPGDYAVCLNALNKVLKAKGKYGTFSSEDVISELSDGYETLAEPRILGAVFRTARVAGRIYGVLAGALPGGTLTRLYAIMAQKHAENVGLVIAEGKP